MNRFILSILLAGIFISLTPLTAKETPTTADHSLSIISVVKETVVRVDLKNEVIDGYVFSLYNQNGSLLDKRVLEGATSSLEFDKPDRGVYWVSMKKGLSTGFKRFSIN